MHGPLLEQAARHHVGLDIFENLSQHLMTGLRATCLDRRQPLVEARYRSVVLDLTFGTALQSHNRYWFIKHTELEM